MAFTSSSVSSSSILVACTPAAACKNQQKPAFAAFPNQGKKPQSRLVAVSAAGDVSADGTTYLIAGAIAVALVGTAFPILFSRKDTCPVCDGAGFVRKSSSALRANAARKDQAQILKMPKVEPKLTEPFLGFTNTAEIWNSRACMIGLIGTFIVELILHKGILQVIGVEIGKGLDLPL